MLAAASFASCLHARANAMVASAVRRQVSSVVRGGAEARDRNSRRAQDVRQAHRWLARARGLRVVLRGHVRERHLRARERAQARGRDAQGAEFLKSSINFTHYRRGRLEGQPIGATCVGDVEFLLRPPLCTVCTTVRVGAARSDVETRPELLHTYIHTYIHTCAGSCTLVRRIRGMLHTGG